MDLWILKDSLEFKALIMSINFYSHYLYIF